MKRIYLYQMITPTTRETKKMKKIASIIVIMLMIPVICIAGEKKMGALLFLTGDQSFLGQEVKNGMLLAMDHLKENGQDVKIIFADSKDSPRDGITAFNRLVSLDKVSAIISTGDVVSMALAPVADKTQTVMLSTIIGVPHF